MNKVQSTLFTTIILLNFATAKGHNDPNYNNRYTRQVDKNYQQQIQAATQYNVPSSTDFGRCTQEQFKIAVRALSAAKRDSVKLPHAPSDHASLSQNKCRHSLASNQNDWVELTYEEADQVCSVYVVMNWTSLNSHNLRGHDNNRFNLNGKHTERANAEFAKCVSIKQDNSKVVIDIDEELEEEVVEDGKIVDDVVAQEEEVIKVTPAVNTHAQEQEPEVPADKKDTHAEEKKDAHAEDKKDTHVDEKNGNEEQHVDVPAQQHEELIAPTFGPSRKVLPSHNQRGSNGPDDRAEPEVQDNDDSNTTSGNPNPHVNGLIGGWNHCNPDEYSLARQVLSMLIAQNKITGITIYDENVKECYHQLVNGMNYNMVISINKALCQLSFHKEFKGEISELPSAPSLGIDRCTDKYKAMVN